MAKRAAVEKPCPECGSETHQTLTADGWITVCDNGYCTSHGADESEPTYKVLERLGEHKAPRLPGW